MVALRRRPRGGLVTPFGLGFLTFIVAPSAIGSQDLAALFARQPVVADPLPSRFSLIGTAHGATFNMPRPMSTAMPMALSYTLAGLDTRYANITASIRERLLGESPLAPDEFDLPAPDRRLKGNRLLPPAREKRPETAAATEADEVEPFAEAVTAEEKPPVAVEIEDAAVVVATPKPDATEIADSRRGFQLASVDPVAPAPAAPRVAEAGAPDVAAPPDERDTSADLTDSLAVGIAFTREEADPAFLTARLYFGSAPMGQTLEQVQPWQDGEAPKIETLTVSVDADAQSAALAPDPPAVDRRPATAPGAPAETIASKGEVTGEGRRPMTPAERLGLTAKTRPKQERCLASGIYFESRGESVRGQIAVAQVILNRAFSGHYPSTVCGVVYQNAHRRLACQFTFACDRHPDVVRDQDAWKRAMSVASGALDGKLWLPEVGKATHYHAYWVRPGWVRTMHKLHRIGVHTFYRPRKWGDGADAPAWGDAAATAEAAKAL